VETERKEMTRWPTKPLGELVSLEYGKALKAEQRSSNGRFPVFGSNGVVGAFDRALVSEPTIVVGRKGAIGEAHLAENGCWPIDTAFYTVLRERTAVSLRFLLLWFRSVDIKSLAITSTIPGLNRNTLYSQHVPLPPLAEQERIVKLLDEADELRKLRVQADRRTADLIPAIFHEMFGDPLKKTSQLPILPLGEVVDFGSGATPSKENPEFWNGRTPWVSPKDMKVEEITDAEDHVSAAAFEKSNLQLVPKDTVLIVVRGMILAHTVPIRLCRVPVAINQDMKGLLPKQPIEPEFLRWSLQAQHPHLLNQVSTAGHGTKKLDSDRLRGVTIPVPPLTLQKEFAARVSDIRTMQAEQAASRRRLDDLFQSMLHCAFQGEL
jgi:type I restriction enzyme S subunit